MKNPEAADFVMADISAVIELLKSHDARTVENSAGVLGNLVRKNGHFIDELIKDGAIDLLVDALNYGDDTGGRVVLQLAVFCQHKAARQYLVKIGADKYIKPFLKSNDAHVKKYAKSILDSFGV